MICRLEHRYKKEKAKSFEYKEHANHYIPQALQKPWCGRSVLSLPKYKFNFIAQLNIPSELKCIVQMAVYATVTYRNKT